MKGILERIREGNVVFYNPKSISGDTFQEITESLFNNHYGKKAARRKIPAAKKKRRDVWGGI